MINTVMDEDRNKFKEQLKDLPSYQQQLLRRRAAERLKEFSFEEIGTSDVSNELFSMWKSYNKNFQAILEDQCV